MNDEAERLLKALGPEFFQRYAAGETFLQRSRSHDDQLVVLKQIRTAVSMIMWILIGAVVFFVTCRSIEVHQQNANEAGRRAEQLLQ